MREPEWNGSPPENQLFRLMVEAANRCVDIERVFVVSSENVQRALNIPAVRVRAAGKDPARLKGFIVDSEYFHTNDQPLEQKAGDGFIMFDERVALIDAFAQDGFSRGRVTMHAITLSSLLNRIVLQRHTRQLTLEHAHPPESPSTRGA